MDQDEPNQTSADLPFELQSKMFDQLAAICLGGAGLTVTLIGSVLSNAPGIVWLSAVEFGLAALVALYGNIALINNLFERKESRKSSRIATGLCVGLLGMAVGSLCTSVYLDGMKDSKAATDAVADGGAGKWPAK